MNEFETIELGEALQVTAPDGAQVRILCATRAGSGAHFTLAPGQISMALQHRSVEEIWFIIAGRGRMWRKAGECEEVVELKPGLSLSIPLSTRFQFRNDGDEPLEAYAVTMPPWPREDEAVPVSGRWVAG